MSKIPSQLIGTLMKKIQDACCFLAKFMLEHRQDSILIACPGFIGPTELRYEEQKQFNNVQSFPTILMLSNESSMGEIYAVVSE